MMLAKYTIEIKKVFKCQLCFFPLFQYNYEILKQIILKNISVLYFKDDFKSFKFKYLFALILIL